MKVQQFRQVLEAAAQFRERAGDKAGAETLRKFAVSLKSRDSQTVAALAKKLSQMPAP